MESHMASSDTVSQLDAARPKSDILVSEILNWSASDTETLGELIYPPSCIILCTIANRSTIRKPEC